MSNTVFFQSEATTLVCGHLDNFPTDQCIKAYSSIVEDTTLNGQWLSKGFHACIVEPSFFCRWHSGGESSAAPGRDIHPGEPALQKATQHVPVAKEWLPRKGEASDFRE